MMDAILAILFTALCIALGWLAGCGRQYLRKHYVPFPDENRNHV